MISIDGLTTKQKSLLDVMWVIEDWDKLKSFIATLPARDAIDAHSLIQILQMETWETEGCLDQFEKDAKTVIERMKTFDKD
jgi:hypothetical protein